jgi:hypothetical protein
MEKQEQTGFQKFLQKSLNVISFIVFIIAKAFTGSKQKKVAEKEPQSKLGFKEMTVLVKKAYGSVKNEVNEGKEEVKALRENEKRQYKTWARVKQDFREWYDGIRNEFEQKAEAKRVKEPEKIQESNSEINSE